MSPSPAKRARVDPSPTASPLLRHWHVVKNALLPFLTASDCIALLGTCPTLYQNKHVVKHVAEAVHSKTQCLFQGCVGDWCGDAPVMDFEAWYDYEQTRELGRYHETHAGFEETLRSWQNKLGSCERSISLLSLAWLIASELEPILYSPETPNVTTYFIVPFILPLSRLEEIKRQYPQHGPTSAMGFHIENSSLSANGRDVQCAFCEALQSVDQEAQAHRDRYEKEPREFEQKLRDDGLDSETEEFHDLMDEFEETRTEYDEQFEEDYVYENRGHMAAEWSKEGRLPPLKLVDHADDEEELAEAAREEFYAPRLRGSSELGYCERKLRPLVALFQRNGFGRIHRTTLGSDAFPNIKYFDDEIRRIEMVGAEAPHGFFAGVYIIERYT